MTNWAAYNTSTLETLDFPADAREKALNAASLDYTGDTNLQNGMIRLLRGGSNTVTVQEYNGTSWVTQSILAASIGDIAAGQVTSGTLADARIPSLNASKITAGVFADVRIPTLDASKIGTGVFADARIPTLDASKTGTGTFVLARIPTLDATRHGNQTNGSLHAVATQGTAGFMSQTDKQKVDNLPAQRIVALSSDQSLANNQLESTAFAPLSGMSLSANTFYRIDFLIMMDGANGATSQARIMGSDFTTVTGNYYRFAKSLSSAPSTTVTDNYFSNDLNITAGAAFPEYALSGSVLYKVGGSAATLHVGLRNFSGGALDVYEGSHVIVTELTSTV
jgi:hypothetical protein